MLRVADGPFPGGPQRYLSIYMYLSGTYEQRPYISFAKEVSMERESSELREIARIALKVEE